MSVGHYITHQGQEWLIVATGPWGVRCQRGHGSTLSTIVLPWGELIYR